MCGFIAQLVERRTGIAEVTGSNPFEALNFFRLLLSNCLRWLETISSTYILMGRYNHYVSLDATIMISSGPKGRPAEPHRHHGKEKETHEGFSLWLSWLAVLLVGAYARRRRRSRATWRPYSSQLAETCILGF